MPSSRSRQSATRVTTITQSVTYSTPGSRTLPFHSKPSCNRKNSLKAGSSGNWPSFFGVLSSCSPRLIADAFRRCPGADCFALPLERHICASMPSICRSPFRIFCVSLDAILSNARDSSASISNVAALRVSQCGSDRVASDCRLYGGYQLRWRQAVLEQCRRRQGETEVYAAKSCGLRREDVF
jgi:hypothetical protein